MIVFVVVLVLILMGFVYLVVKSQKDSKENNEKSNALFKDYIEKTGFKIDKAFKSTGNGFVVAFDQKRKEFAIINRDSNLEIIPFDRIDDCTLIIDGHTISKSSTSNIIGGAILAGGIGALIGSTMKNRQEEVIKSIGLQITINDLVKPIRLLVFSDNENEAKDKKEIVAEWHGIFSTVIKRNLN